MASVASAIDFVVGKVDQPALDHESFPAELKGKVRHSMKTVNTFKRVGDLHRYLDRFVQDDSGEDEIFIALAERNLESYETIYDEFCERFKYDLDDYTVLSDFVIGDIYSSYDIANFAQTYNIQKGIYLIGEEPEHEAIFIKVTLGGDGKYSNEWLEEGKSLKYYFEAHKNSFSESNIGWKSNRSIINAGDKPIYVFIKSGKKCQLDGLYNYLRYNEDPDGSLWFQLDRQEDFDAPPVITLESFEENLERKVQSSLDDTSEQRRERLKAAPSKPQKQVVKATNFRRNPDVIAEVLSRASGYCELCSSAAPFISKAKGTPYLEVHHIEKLADGGDDTVENAIALCPNCHRGTHFG